MIEWQGSGSGSGSGGGGGQIGGVLEVRTWHSWFGVELLVTRTGVEHWALYHARKRVGQSPCARCSTHLTRFGIWKLRCLHKHPTSRSRRIFAAFNAISRHSIPSLPHPRNNTTRRFPQAQLARTVIALRHLTSKTSRSVGRVRIHLQGRLY